VTATVAHGPNADVVHYSATRFDDHRRVWETVAKNAERSIGNALSSLEDEALAIFRADDTRPGAASAAEPGASA
jgi:hypothetical protein